MELRFCRQFSVISGMKFLQRVDDIIMDRSSTFETCFHHANALAPLALAGKLSSMIRTYVRPVVVCVGSDRVAGDSLGPAVGTRLSRECGLPVFGTLRAPVTAREIAPLRELLRKAFPHAPVLCVDAAVGEREEIGLVKLLPSPLRPGSGTRKQLGTIGDLSVLGIVAAREDGFPALENTPLRRIAAMADVISEALLSLCRRLPRCAACL